MPETDPDKRDEQEPTTGDDGPAVEELESDPAYAPQDDTLKDLKGG